MSLICLVVILLVVRLLLNGRYVIKILLARQEPKLTVRKGLAKMTADQRNPARVATFVENASVRVVYGQSEMV